MAKQLLDLNEFAEALYRAGNPFAKDIIELIERNDVLEDFIADVEDVLIGCGAVAPDNENADLVATLRVLLPEVE